LRKLAAGALAIPFLAFILVSAGLRKSGAVKLLMVAGMVTLLVTTLLIGLPAKQVSGTGNPTFAPLTPQADAHPENLNLALDAPFKVQFTKPMNEGAVESAVSITPKVDVDFRWDATAQTLALTPKSHWTPNTEYQVVISGKAADQQGLSLAEPVNEIFQSGAPTSGTITATDVVDKLVSPGTALQLTFTRPVKLATVLLRWGLSPQVPVKIEGDDPNDVNSRVFTMTPADSLGSNRMYTISISDGGTDASGSPLEPVKPLVIQTMSTPEVVRFRPQAGAISYDPNQPVSVRFTVPMDRKSAQAAFSVKVNGRAVTGKLVWAEGDTVLVLSPRSSFPIGSTVTAMVTTVAKSKDGQRIGSKATASFTVQKPKAVDIRYPGAGTAAAKSPWYASEVYYMSLMNCTRTGGWVTRGGACSTETHHTLPAQGKLTLNAKISNLVSRPYAKYMADRRLLDHYLIHDPKWRLCNWGGFCGWAFGENIASPTSSGKAGMIAIEVFYQNEYWCRCDHYYNIMAPFLHEAGVGVWVSRSVRVSIDFIG
jgi:hypothetical protein